MTPSSSAAAAWATAISGRSGGIDQPRERLSIRDVARLDLRLTTKLTELFDQLRRTRRLGSAVADQQQMAGTVALRQPSRHERADPGGTAGDEDRAVVKG